MLSNVIVSYIRVGVAALVGTGLTWLAATLHIVITPGSESALVALATAVITLAYYALVRLLEHLVPQFGVLLGVPAAPDYAQLLSDGAHVITTLQVPSGPDPLAREGNDPNTSGASRPAQRPLPPPTTEPADVAAAAPVDPSPTAATA